MNRFFSRIGLPSVESAELGSKMQLFAQQSVLTTIIAQTDSLHSTEPHNFHFSSLDEDFEEESEEQESGWEEDEVELLSDGLLQGFFLKFRKGLLAERGETAQSGLCQYENIHQTVGAARFSDGRNGKEKVRLQKFFSFCIFRHLSKILCQTSAIADLGTIQALFPSLYF